MKLTIHVEGTKEEIAAELTTIASEFGGCPCDTAPDTEPTPTKRGRKPKPEVEEEPTEIEEDPEFNLPGDEEPTEEEPEAATIDDDEMRKRAAAYIAKFDKAKKGEAARAKLGKVLAKYKVKQVSKVPAGQREAFLTDLGA